MESVCEEGVGGVVRNVTWCVCVCVCVSERANTTSTACEEGRVEVRAHTHTTSTARPRGQEREGRAARALCARLAAVWGGGRKAWKFELHVCTARRRGASSPCHVHDCGTGDVLRESANVDLARGPYVWDRPSQQPSPMPIPTPSPRQSPTWSLMQRVGCSSRDALNTMWWPGGLLFESGHRLRLRVSTKSRLKSSNLLMKCWFGKKLR